MADEDVDDQGAAAAIVRGVVVVVGAAAEPVDGQPLIGHALDVFPDRGILAEGARGSGEAGGLDIGQTGLAAQGRGRIGEGAAGRQREREGAEQELAKRLHRCTSAVGVC